MEFFHVFKVGGTYGVNRLTLGDMFGVGLITFMVYLVILAFLSIIFPTILLLMYVLWMIKDDSGEGHDGQAIAQRLILNVITLISVIYSVLDYHYGWIAHNILGSAIGVEGFDGLIGYNMTIGLISTALFFFGHELYRLSSKGRILFFIAAILFAFKFISPLGDGIADMISQAEPFMK